MDPGIDTEYYEYLIQNCQQILDGENPPPLMPLEELGGCHFSAGRPHDATKQSGTPLTIRI